MDVLSKDDVKVLAGGRERICVSVYLPTHPVGEDIQQDPIRFKNLLRRAEELLEAEGIKQRDIKELLTPCWSLLDDVDFWQCQSDGLAVFAARDFFRYFRLPEPFEELVVVTDRFHIKPLIPVLSESGRFYVLALSQNEIKLLHGSAHSMSEVHLKDVPTSLAEALKYDDPEKQLQYHTGTPGHGGLRPAVFHGHGAGGDAAGHKVEIKRYFDQVDKGIHEILKDEHDPLVLAGVEYVLPIYHEANSYPHLLEEGVVGNPEGLSTDDIRERAWKVVEPVFQKARGEAMDLYRELAGTGRASNDLEEVAAAAYDGRIETLFVALGVQRWGSFDAGKREVKLHDEQQPGDEDMLDFAAAHSLIHQGRVYALDAGKMPDGEPMAAVFRY
jgi:hypothetical protein